MAGTSVGSDRGGNAGSTTRLERERNGRRGRRRRSWGDRRCARGGFHGFERKSAGGRSAWRESRLKKECMSICRMGTPPARSSASRKPPGSKQATCGVKRVRSMDLAISATWRSVPPWPNERVISRMGQGLDRSPVISVPWDYWSRLIPPFRNAAMRTADAASCDVQRLSHPGGWQHVHEIGKPHRLAVTGNLFQRRFALVSGCKNRDCIRS